MYKASTFSFLTSILSTQRRLENCHFWMLDVTYLPCKPVWCADKFGNKIRIQMTADSEVDDAIKSTSYLLFCQHLSRFKRRYMFELWAQTTSVFRCSRAMENIHIYQHRLLCLLTFGPEHIYQHKLLCLLLFGSETVIMNRLLVYRFEKLYT